MIVRNKIEPHLYFNLNTLLNNRFKILRLKYLLISCSVGLSLYKSTKIIEIIVDISLFNFEYSFFSCKLIITDSRFFISFLSFEIEGRIPFSKISTTISAC